LSRAAGRISGRIGLFGLAAGIGNWRAGKGEMMQYSVGDKVVHPRRGVGRIIGVERQELLEAAKRYYVIDMPANSMTVRIPVRRVDEVGLRPAMTREKLARVVETLRDRPRRLPADYKERQEKVRETIQMARPIRMAKVVRDLTWHGRSEHLTKTDSELLRLVQDFLASEMALTSDTDLAEANETIARAMAGTMDAMEERARRRELLTEGG